MDSDNSALLNGIQDHSGETREVEGLEVVDDSDEEGVGRGEKMGYVVDSDASTDCENQEEHALNLDGDEFPPVRRLSYKTTGIERELSLCNGPLDKNHENPVTALSGYKAVEMETETNAERNQVTTKVCEMKFDHELENSHRCLQDNYSYKSMSRINNSRVRKLYNEAMYAGKEEATYKTDTHCGSQEPGELSQAMAMDVVDKLLCNSDVGSSQKIDGGKTKGSNSPPILNARGVCHLAVWADHRSSFVKSEVFNWADNHADEFRGDFPYKNSDSFIESRGNAWETNSQFTKSKHLRPATIRDSGNISERMEDKDLEYFEMTSLASPNLRMVVDSSITKTKNLHISATREDLSRVANEHLNSKSVEQQLEVADVGYVQEVYDIGPNTQMAAEAMEALLHGPPLHHELRDANPVTGDLFEDSSIVKTRKRSSKNDSVQKRFPCTDDLKCSELQPVQKKSLPTKQNKGRPNSSGKHFSKSRVKNKSKNAKEKAEVKREKWKHDVHFNAKDSTDLNNFTRSFQQDNKCGVSSPSDFQPAVAKRFILGEISSNAGSVASQIMQSKSLELSKRAQTSSGDYENAANAPLEVSNPGDNMVEDKLAGGASFLLSPKIRGLNKPATLNRSIKRYPELQNIEEQYKQELSTSFVLKDVFSHPKRRRTHRNSSRKSNVNAIQYDNLPNVVQLSTRQGGNETTVKSLHEILSSVRRKKRSVSAFLPSRTDDITLNTRKVSSVTGFRKGSSVNSYFDSRESLPALYEIESVVAKDDSSLVNNRVLLEEGVLLKQGTDPENNGEDIKGNAKQEESFKRKDQPCGLLYSTTLENIGTIPLVCKAQDPLQTSYSKQLRKSSIARELIRLEASRAASTWLLKDSRRRKDISKVRVLFSNNLSEDIIKQQKKILARLKVPIASSISDATHFVADKFARTRNMLEAMAMGIPVVSHMWLDSCRQASYFINEKKYLLRDLKKEKEIGFSMPISLAHARQHPLLQGRRVLITPNVKPDRELLVSLVKAAHGQPMESTCRTVMDNEVLDNLLVISCDEDYAMCSPLLDIGAEVFSSELLLNGIVIQKLEFERHRLFANHAKTTR